MPPPRYPSDLSDEEWAILQPLLSSAEKRGRPPKWPLRHVADAVFYLLRSGCSWRMLPHEYPPWRSEEHTSELQSRQYLVCRLLLEKKKPTTKISLPCHDPPTT